MNEHFPKHVPSVWMAAALTVGLSLAACQMDSNNNPPDSSQTTGSEQKVLIGGIQWYTDYDAAVEVARKQDKSLWVHFGENPG